jgi:hypothetical protein
MKKLLLGSVMVLLVATRIGALGAAPVQSGETTLADDESRCFAVRSRAQLDALPRGVASWLQSHRKEFYGPEETPEHPTRYVEFDWHGELARACRVEAQGVGWVVSVVPDNSKWYGILPVPVHGVSLQGQGDVRPLNLAFPRDAGCAVESVHAEGARVRARAVCHGNESPDVIAVFEWHGQKFVKTRAPAQPAKR